MTTAHNETNPHPEGASKEGGWTPGPWHVGAQNDGLHVIDRAPSPAPYDAPIPAASGPNVVATPNWRLPAYEANTHLIAASPDLFAALKRADEFIRNGIELGFIRMPDAGTPDPAHETPDIIRAALSRAQGDRT